MIDTIYKKALAMFGDIKVFKWPMFLLYHPEGYGVTGEDVRKIINIVKPGDILLRGYKNYLDGYFIPGFFSHAGFMSDDDNVIHSMAEGVKEEDIINFCRCDFMAVLRFKEGKTTQSDIYAAVLNAKSLIGTAYDFEFESGDNEVYCTEAVMQIWDHKKDELNITPQVIKALFGLIKKSSYMPDQFWNCTALETVYMTDHVSYNMV